MQAQYFAFMKYTINTIRRIEVKIVDEIGAVAAVAYMYPFGEGWRIFDNVTAEEVGKCKWKDEILQTYCMALLDKLRTESIS
jgi:hypothetical protein